MKPKFSTLVITLLLLSVVFSCSKSEPEIQQKETSFEELLNKNLTLIVKPESDAFIMYKEGSEYKFQFDKEILTFMFDSEQSSSRVNGCGTSVGTEVCGGKTGYGFATCTKGYVDGGCAVTVWKDNKGTYHAKIAQL